MQPRGGKHIPGQGGGARRSPPWRAPGRGIRVLLILWLAGLVLTILPARAPLALEPGSDPGPDPGSDPSGPFVVLLVAAAGLDYTDQGRLVRQFQKRSRFKQGFMGHSWVYLEGTRNGRREVIDAGLSPQGAGAIQFMGGVLDLARYGYVNPTADQRRNPRHEPNPIAYLWRDHGNGYLQPAAEPRLRPTYAARLELNAAQYRAIRARLNPDLPSHRGFQLTGQQCSSFLVEIAALAGVELEHEVTIEVPSEVRVGPETLRLWTDPRYARLTLSSPDVVERSLRVLVAQGRARDVLRWYLEEGRP